LSRPTVFIALATPAQLTQIRSWPCAEDAANLRRHLLAALGVAVENGDLDPLRRKRPRRRLAKAGGAAGHHRGDVAVEFH